MHLPSRRPDAAGNAPRPRILLLAYSCATVALGLATRRFPSAFPAVVTTFGGDALWAMLIFWLAALVRPSASGRTLAIAALGISIAVECSQLVHTPWLDAVRATRLGALVLGQGFLWSDLVAYAVGVLAATLIDALWWSRRH